VLITSLACDCGFRDEVRGDCPDRLDCGGCGQRDGLRRITPRYSPPPDSGRLLTEAERRRITTAAAGSAPEPRE